jgi:hypothetical protein
MYQNRRDTRRRLGMTDTEPAICTLPAPLANAASTGWAVVCDGCRVQVDFFIEVMS